MVIDWTNFDSKISKYFTAGEVCNKDPRRIPANGSQAETNILALAKELDKVREAWGEPIGVTSWYRPAAINRAVGGVSNSQHINGSAADIYPFFGGGYDFEQWLDARWGGALGFGQTAKRGFTHVDLRGGGWQRGGGQIRWNY